MLVKVLLYGYATGVRSSRQLERLCQESLPYLFLTRGDGPSYRTLCTARVEYQGLLKDVWLALFAIAEAAGIKRAGRIAIDSTKIAADSSPEAVVKREDYAAVLQELERVLVEAEEVDKSEETEGAVVGTRLGKKVETDQMRDILRRVRKERAKQKREQEEQAKLSPPVAELLRTGIDTCIPSSYTAGDLHRDMPVGTHLHKATGGIPFTFDERANLYRCPEGNELKFAQMRPNNGQTVSVYRAVRDCTGCPLAKECLVKAGAKRRTLKISAHHATLKEAQERFAEPEHRERYLHRADRVETIFGFLRGVLGFRRWFLRGAERVACEATLFKTAYQFRKIHRGIACPRIGGPVGTGPVARGFPQATQLRSAA